MPDVKVTLSANAGVCIEVSGRKIWVDALYEGADVGFSRMSAALQRQVLESDAFANPDHIVYTHCHVDHYSKTLANLAMKRWGRAKAYLPEQELEGQILLTGDEMRFVDGDLTLRFLLLPHAGAQYAGVKLYGLVISLPGCNILLPGDCEVASPQLAKAIGDTKIDLAIVDFPWITLRGGRAFLEQYVRPDHLIGYHLPFAEDDKNGFRISAAKAVQSMAGDVRLLWEPMQTDTIKI